MPGPKRKRRNPQGFANAEFTWALPMGGNRGLLPDYKRSSVAVQKWRQDLMRDALEGFPDRPDRAFIGRGEARQLVAQGEAIYPKGLQVKSPPRGVRPADYPGWDGGGLGDTSLGYTAFCTEFSDALAALSLALGHAEALNLTGKDSYKLAKAFYTKQTGFFTRDWIAIGSACSDDVNEANSLTQNLSADIVAAGGAAVDTSTVPEPKSPFFLGLPKWVVPTAAVVGILWVARPYIPFLAALFRKRVPKPAEAPAT